jgi:transglutaminase-like putative cysteine protease
MQPGSAALFQLEPLNRAGCQRLVESSFGISPANQSPPETFADIYGNVCYRMALPGGKVTVSYRSLVDVERSPAPTATAAETPFLDLAPDTLHYLIPSRYCPSDRMLKLASNLFGWKGHGRERVAAICEWININLTYMYGTSNAATTALDTLIERRGVCRDFAHLAIAFCRALNIPARYVSGYCVGLKPPDFHAYFEAWVDGCWTAFDPTTAQPREALVAAAVGRDAADCAWSTLYGSGYTTRLDVNVTEAR